jgi:hypothetical protein
MSFTLVIGDILQYAYNIFASALPVLYLFIGGAFAAFVLMKLLQMVRN